MPATTRCSSAAWRRPGSSRTISSSAWRWVIRRGRTSTAWLLPGSCDMTSSDVSEAAKAVVRRNTEEVQSKGDFDVFEELFADDFLDHTPHQGLFFGIAPTGREIHFETVDAMRVRNGQIVEHWGVANLLS